MVYTIIVFYRFKELSTSQEEKAREEWSELKSKLPEGVQIISNNRHAFGSNWNGFLVIEIDSFEKYVEFWKWFKDRIRWYVTETQTIIGIKGD